MGTIKIGKFRIAFGRTLWMQARVPIRVWHRLWFWFTKEVNPGDINLEQIDEKRQFLDGAEVERGGRRYRYQKAGRNSWTKEANKE